MEEFQFKKDLEYFETLKNDQNFDPRKSVENLISRYEDLIKQSVKKHSEHMASYGETLNTRVLELQSKAKEFQEKIDVHKQVQGDITKKLADADQKANRTIELVHKLSEDSQEMKAEEVAELGTSVSGVLNVYKESRNNMQALLALQQEMHKGKVEMNKFLISSMPILKLSEIIIKIKSDVRQRKLINSILKSIFWIIALIVAMLIEFFLEKLLDQYLQTIIIPQWAMLSAFMLIFFIESLVLQPYIERWDSIFFWNLYSQTLGKIKVLIEETDLAMQQISSELPQAEPSEDEVSEVMRQIKRLKRKKLFVK